MVPAPKFSPPAPKPGAGVGFVPNAGVPTAPKPVAADVAGVGAKPGSAATPNAGVDVAPEMFNRKKIRFLLWSQLSCQLYVTISSVRPSSTLACRRPLTVSICPHSPTSCYLYNPWFIGVMVRNADISQFGKFFETFGVSKKL